MPHRTRIDTSRRHAAAAPHTDHAPERDYDLYWCDEVPWWHNPRDGRDRWTASLVFMCPCSVTEIAPGAFVAVADGEALDSPGAVRPFVFGSAEDAMRAAHERVQERATAGDLYRHYPGTRGNAADRADHEAVEAKWVSAITGGR